RRHPAVHQCRRLGGELHRHRHRATVPALREGPGDLTMAIRSIITDIEGTTSSISFVHDVLFPYARRALPGFIEARRHDPVVRVWLEQVAAETGVDADSPVVTETLLHWIDIDRK